jgi:hypothetical protein
MEPSGCGEGPAPTPLGGGVILLGSGSGRSAPVVAVVHTQDVVVDVDCPAILLQGHEGQLVKSSPIIQARR